MIPKVGEWSKKNLIRGNGGLNPLSSSIQPLKHTARLQVTELVSQGLLAERLADVFRDDKSGSPYKLYKHQVDAIRLGTDKKDFIVTSGTGSGKTLTFIGTILNHLFAQS